MGSVGPLQSLEITKIGVIGTGVMGSMLSLLFAEHAGVDVSIYDRSETSMQLAVEKANKAGLGDRVHACKDYETLCQSLGSPKIFLFSLPHGPPGDRVVRTLEPYLRKGDVVIDGSNENFHVTQKRQAFLQPRGVSYIGMGVSGGFNGARHGPSLMPSGDEWALDRLMPLLTKIAAKDELGRPCVTKIGTGGSGHYVKMIHNGIEHGVMSVLCEAWEIMDSCLRMTGDEIGDVFESWNEKGELRNNFLVAISGPICRTRNEDGNGFLLHDIGDAVVQDANDSEGTGVWANLEAVSSHVPAPSLTAAHYLRLASANVGQRRQVGNSLGAVSPGKIILDRNQRQSFLEDLRKAVYATVLLCFIQGLDLLRQASERQGWGIDLEQVVRIWRAGCIIKSDDITDLFERHYARSPGQHPLLGTEICSELRRCWPSLKTVVLKGLEVDAHLPALGASLEYLKYSGSTNLPTSFMEAQLDAFGAHGYELKGEQNGYMAKGKHHSHWSQ
ncbi:6-phosphogluconate dehydrogenase (decarboxylating) [Rhinocladiella mackenziei CBS 650.93]|uniref:6-phosphogluconate dehydrogenase, decarboxylating n=1 Tax=Rhinocladiella mackenziei CBS 650.93 TaxID=1442369 RepID=A0A0D2H4K2_9EURO|nr:6-phosphogluconate dehydrogenase (decarboxylating) [Rhinocladiella mackenziei CBS 650.93]KIX05348.1 6-phosphogluconate dehydrogenase (decarboxylating) [Rhinocladiella mackenziei CBS 650.93]